MKKLGTGSLTLAVAPAYTGNTTVNNGTLNAPAGINTPAATVYVATPATLNASSIVADTLTIGGPALALTLGDLPLVSAAPSAAATSLTHGKCSVLVPEDLSTTGTLTPLPGTYPAPLPTVDTSTITGAQPIGGSMAPVPEPSTIVLLVLAGLVAFGLASVVCWREFDAPLFLGKRGVVDSRPPSPKVGGGCLFLDVPTAKAEKVIVLLMNTSK